MAVLETTFLVDVLQNRHAAVALLKEIENREPLRFVAAPTVMELWEGTFLSNASEQERARVEALLASVAVLPLDTKSAKEAGEIAALLRKKGIPTQVHDIMIAGIARANGETLITRDEHYAKIPGLKVLKY